MSEEACAVVRELKDSRLWKRRGHMSFEHFLIAKVPRDVSWDEDFVSSMRAMLDTGRRKRPISQK